MKRSTAFESSIYHDAINADGNANPIHPKRSKTTNERVQVGRTQVKYTFESCNWRSTFSPFPIVSSKNTNAASEHSPLLSYFHPSPTKLSSVNKVSQGTARKKAKSKAIDGETHPCESLSPSAFKKFTTSDLSQFLEEMPT
jgi:hypothetical protein